jgi:phospholipid/cholesterol/gamma-HCH transport system ATP-binding protein
LPVSPLAQDSQVDQPDAPLISLNHVFLGFNGKSVLEDITFDVGRAEVVAIMGPSGSGKSTVLKLIAGLLAPDSGTVTVRSDHLGMVFQYSALLSGLSVYDNVALPLLKAQQVSPEEVEPRVMRVLRLVGLEDVGDASPDSLSGGMKKRVSIARAMVIEPDILLFDEPSAGLDPINSSRLEADMRAITMQVSAASVVVTHNVETIEHMADRVLILHDRHLVWQGERQDFLTTSDPYPAQFREGSPQGPIQL